MVEDQGFELKYLLFGLRKVNIDMSKHHIRKKLKTTAPYICAICKNNATHNNLPLTLEMDHIDGNRFNDSLDNLRWLCPNCHSQQPTTNKPYKYSHKRIKDIDINIFEEIVNNSKNIREICNKLRVSDSGANYKLIKNIIKSRNMVTDILETETLKLIGKRKNPSERPNIGATKIIWPQQ